MQDGGVWLDPATREALALSLKVALWSTLCALPPAVGVDLADMAGGVYASLTAAAGGGTLEKIQRPQTFHEY